MLCLFGIMNFQSMDLQISMNLNEFIEMRVLFPISVLFLTRKGILTD